MNSATHDEIIRLFPGMQDHTVLEIQATEATGAELEAALQLLQDDDEGLLDIKQRKSGRRMSAFTNSGRSDHWKLRKSKGS